MKQEELFLYGALSCSNDCCLEDYYFLFAKLIGLRMQLYGHKVSVGKCQPAQNCYFEGLLLRSQLFGWEERFARVDKTGLHVYKKDKTTVTLDVSFGAVKELWTRF